MLPHRGRSWLAMTVDIRLRVVRGTVEVLSVEVVGAKVVGVVVVSVAVVRVGVAGVEVVSIVVVSVRRYPWPIRRLLLRQRRQLTPLSSTDVRRQIRVVDGSPIRRIHMLSRVRRKLCSKRAPSVSPVSPQRLLRIPRRTSPIQTLRILIRSSLRPLISTTLDVCTALCRGVSRIIHRQTM